jgi:BMFP domain-containing protein YqiC
MARIRQIRRSSDAADERERPPMPDPWQRELHALEARITHLEQLVQGLQDSVHRESTRLSQRIGELEARVQPAALARAISKDARERGL